MNTLILESHYGVVIGEIKKLKSQRYKIETSDDVYKIISVILPDN